MYINKSTNQVYTGGVLRTPKGNINNPSLATLREWGFVPYTPKEPEPIPASEQRRMAYEAECDPLSMAYIGYLMEGDETSAASCKAAYLTKKREIRERIPDEEA